MNRNSAADDSGMTLVELLVYSALALLVLTIVGGLLFNSFATQRTVTDSAASTNGSLLVAQSVGAGVRNSIELRSVSGDPGILIAQVLDDALSSPPVTHCEAWYFGAGELRTTRYAPSTSTAPADDASVAAWLAATAGDFSGWTLLGAGAAALTDASGAVMPVFIATGSNEVDLGLEVSTGQGVSVLVDTSTVSRQTTPPAGVTELCF